MQFALSVLGGRRRNIFIHEIKPNVPQKTLIYVINVVNENVRGLDRFFLAEKPTCLQGKKSY